MCIRDRNKISNPSVSSIGDVVRVNSDVPTTNNIILIIINAAVISPSLYILIIHHLKSNVSPLTKNMFSNAVINTKKNTGFTPLYM